MRYIVSVGQAVADSHHKRVLGNSIHVIPNAVLPGAILAFDEKVRVRLELTDGKPAPVLISVGRLSPEKGYDDLLQVASLLRSMQQVFHLIIVGDGPLRSKLETRINELGIDEEVRLLGARDDVPLLLAASDLYVSTSHSEGLPVSILEAMSAGLPVIATKVGDVDLLLGHNVGIVVPAQKPNRFAIAVKELLNNPSQMSALGLAARTRVSENYNVRSWYEQIRSVYKAVIDQEKTTND